MPQPITHDKNIKEDLTQLSDFDILELYLRSVQVFAEVSSKIGLESGQCFALGNKLWKECIKARDEYRKEYSSKDSKR
jgi:hypothetical protein